ncbi:MAG: ATP-dependent DNA helicase [Myxococcales bacterium]|nr:MAG: ATP-dependent DNA helicase [Myxococcales bacterium]
MARAVERVLREERILFCEAGTGTGKTLAYLVPALLSGKKVVVSTATRALQEQIFQRDLPLIERALGLSFPVALMKGLSNYVCKRRLAEFRQSPEAMRPKYARTLDALSSFVEESETGDFAELAGMAEDDPVRPEVASSSDTRIGAPCQFFDECFVTQMRREAERARLVVVNHHLFFADLALRGPHPGRVLPDYDAVVFDEAHQLEDIATEFFGMRISRRRLDRMLADAERALRAAGALDPLFGGDAGLRSVSAVEVSADVFFHSLGEAAGKDHRITLERDIFTGGVASAWHALDSALEGLAAATESARGRLSAPSLRGPRPASSLPEALELAARRSEDARSALSQVVEGGAGRVTYLERAGQNVTLASSPVDLSTLFRERIFETVPAVVLTSATLSTAGSRSSEPQEDGEGEPERSRSPSSAFSYFRARYGVADSRVDVTELVVPSPFDFEQNALLYTPRDLPAPNHPSFGERAALRVAELCEITGGGAFVLTTSHRMLQHLSRSLPAKLPGKRLLVQGSRPKAALLQAFRADGHAVLIATQSFWEGVDVPGHALRLVVLEKIPFSVPTDPVMVARGRELEAAGESPFMKLAVPAAAIALKQGFGRLIRTQRDVGIVALLDERVHRRGYGKLILSALPGAKRTESLDDVRAFWRDVSERLPGEW